MSTSADADDLSGYAIEFRQTLFGWTWSATAPNGDEVPLRPGRLGRLFAERRNAERDALAAVQCHANPEPPMDGETLRRRIEA